MTRQITEDTLPKRIAALERRISALERALQAMNPGSTYATGATLHTVIGKVSITNSEGVVVGVAPVYDKIT